MDQGVSALFFELQLVALGNKPCLSRNPSNIEWNSILEEANRQSLIGICLYGINLTAKYGQKPERNMLMPLINLLMTIENHNKFHLQTCKELLELLSNSNFRCCIIKGQALSKYYGHLAMYRQCGDIDIYVEAKPKVVLQWIEGKHPILHYDYMHTELSVFKEVKVEVHYRSMISRNLLRNYRLRKLENRFKHKNFINDVSTGIIVPDDTFHALLVLHHIFWHLLVEGVGMRQVMDLLFILQNGNIDKPVFVECVKYLKLKRFTSATMWILTEKYQMNKSFCLFEPDKKEGEFLMQEIFHSGNMGHYDNRINRKEICSKHSLVLMWMRHVLRLLNHYPADVLWTPIGIAYHSLWRKLYRY